MSLLWLVVDGIVVLNGICFEYNIYGLYDGVFFGFFL